MARWKGLEPPTFWFVAKHSIQLSYQRILNNGGYPSSTQDILSQFFQKIKPFIQNKIGLFRRVELQ